MFGSLWVYRSKKGKERYSVEILLNRLFESRGNAYGIAQ
jgi:hypothetical protein